MSPDPMYRPTPTHRSWQAMCTALCTTKRDLLTLLCPCVQVLALIADVEGSKIVRRLPVLLPCLVTLLQPHAAVTNEFEVLSEDMRITAPGWQEAYYGLMLVEKLAVSVPASLPCADDIDAPSTQVRTAACFFTVILFFCLLLYCSSLFFTCLPWA